MPRDVFISFSSKDRETVERIRHGLETRNVSCWMSTRDVPPGADFQEAIINALEQAKVMLLVFSTNANNSAEVKKEVVLASEYEMPLIPVRIENVLPSGAFRYQLTTRNYLDLFEDWDTNLARLADQLTQLIAAHGDTPLASAHVANNSGAVELAFWESVRESKHVEELAAYIHEFPGGRFVALAHLRIRELEKRSQSGSGPVSAARTSTGPKSSDIPAAGAASHTPIAPGKFAPRQPSSTRSTARERPIPTISFSDEEPRQQSSNRSTAQERPIPTISFSDEVPWQPSAPPAGTGVSSPASEAVKKRLKTAVGIGAVVAIAIGVVVSNHHRDEQALSNTNAAAAIPQVLPPADVRPPVPPEGAQSEAAAQGTVADQAVTKITKLPEQPVARDERSAVLSAADKQVLDELADKIGQQIKHLEVVVATGYTDTSGSTAVKNRLSLRRAQAVKAYLISRGIEANRIYTEGKGDRNPIGPQNTPEGRRLSNRVEIEVVGTDDNESGYNGYKKTMQQVVQF